MGGLLVILTDSNIFLPPFPDVISMSVNSFFPLTAGLWDSLSMKCFILTNDINDFKSELTDTFLL